MKCDLAIVVWKTISIGTGTAKDQFAQKLDDMDMVVTDWADDIMQQDEFTVASKEEQIDLVRVSARELGFDRETRYDMICRRANGRELEKCSPDVGPQLRLQYDDQPLGERLIVAMEPICASDGDFSVFYVAHDDDAVNLGGYYAETLCDPDCLFVFRVR